MLQIIGYDSWMKKERNASPVWNQNSKQWRSWRKGRGIWEKRTKILIKWYESRTKKWRYGNRGMKIFNVCHVCSPYAYLLYHMWSPYAYFFVFISFYCNQWKHGKLNFLVFCKYLWCSRYQRIHSTTQCFKILRVVIFVQDCKQSPLLTFLKILVGRGIWKSLSPMDLWIFKSWITITVLV